MPDRAFDIVVRPGGEVVHIHSDAATAVTKELGRPTIRRASHVEPDPETGEWRVDLSPAGGPTLGPYPPDQRDRALADEVAWLEEHYLK